MKKLFLALFLVLMAAGCAGTPETAAPATTLPPATTPPPTEMVPEINIVQAKYLYDTNCDNCHSYNRSTSKKKTYDAWLSTVYRMTTYELNLTDEDAEIIAAYLARTAGK
jgi:mono/diheme cytochrome c family protein